jgi:hypothetical protein
MSLSHYQRMYQRNHERECEYESSQRMYKLDYEHVYEYESLSAYV